MLRGDRRVSEHKEIREVESQGSLVMLQWRRREGFSLTVGARLEMIREGFVEQVTYELGFER